MFFVSKFAVKSSVVLEGLNQRFSSTLWDSVYDYIENVCAANPTITSAVDSKHSANSLHYSGDALDLRIRDWKYDVDTHARAIAWMLGGEYVVVREPDHLHIQIGNRNVIGRVEKVGSGNYIVSKRCK